MIKKISVLIAALFFCLQMNAQDVSSSKPKKDMYFESASETILSWGNVEAENLDPKNVVRFSPFINLGGQFHIDFNQHAGFYTGLSLRNIGIITKLNDSVKVKQRVYTVGIPVGFKFGDMAGTFFAIGAEAEFAVNYKQKVYVNDAKSKTNVWFSDRTNIFLPSVFAEVRFKEGEYLKFGYYLSDFLQSGNQHINVPNLDYIPTKSQMSYISFGYAFRHFKDKTSYTSPETTGTSL
jgi:hypothetical protein